MDALALKIVGVHSTKLAITTQVVAFLTVFTERF
jgi:hypothetical protein